MGTAAARRVQVKGTSQALANCALDTRITQYMTGGTLHGATPPTIAVSGVGFFDRIHAQDGVAPNGVELHPVLSVAQ